MGKQIVSWSPVQGQGATTSNLVAIASMFALDQHHHSLLTHTQLNLSTLESLYTKVERAGFDDAGMEALERLVKSNLLKPDAIPDYTDTIYKGRLDLLVGSDKEWETEEEAERVLKSILRVAKNHYDFLWIDALSDTSNPTTKLLLEDADLVLVNLPQNNYIIKRFFSGELFPEELKGKRFIVLISRYDEKASYSIRNIKRGHRVKAPIYPINYATGFQDASNNSSVTEFFYRSMRAKKGDTVYPFIKSVRDVNTAVMKEFGLRVTEEDDL